MAGNANFDIIASTTLQNYTPTLIDNVFSARPLFHFLNQAGQIQMENGGREIVKPLLYDENVSFVTYTGADNLNVDPSDGISAAQYDWKQASISIVVNGRELRENSGDHQVIDLMQSKVTQAEETLKEKLDEMLIVSDGTGNTNKDFNGLANLVDFQTGVVGGIDVTDTAPETGDTYWASFYDDNATVDKALAVADMRNCYNSISRGNDQPGFVLTTQALYEEYEDLLAPQLRYSDPGTADAGFTNLVFRGIPVVYDAYVPAKHMYFLNPKYLFLVGHPDAWFTPTPFVRPTNQDIKIAQILLQGEFVTNHRASQGLLDYRIPAP